MGLIFIMRVFWKVGEGWEGVLLLVILCCGEECSEGVVMELIVFCILVVSEIVGDW